MTTREMIELLVDGTNITHVDGRKLISLVVKDLLDRIEQLEQCIPKGLQEAMHDASYYQKILDDSWR